MVPSYDKRMLRCALLVILPAGIVCGCTCREPSVPDKRDASDVVFRGTVIAFRESATVRTDGPFSVHDTGKIAVFRVALVWKGRVGQTFEMPVVEETSECTGFTPSHPRIGDDLIIYAKRIGSEYYTAICGYHGSVKGSKELRKLGRGRDPAPSP
jgi:hypothetical protein